jgi:tetratricopeptide (TPR) repeat protein
MAFLTRVISLLGNKDTFVFDLENWIKEVNYQPIEAYAIILKKDGCYDEALAFYNQLYRLRPNFSLIHYNAMKVLAASGQFQKAYRAMQLWCLANIPEKAAIRALEVPIEAIPDLGPGGVEFVSLDPFNISMWSFAVSDAMYHLGTLHTIVTGNMAEADKRAYVASVSGNGGRPTHDIKAATNLGESLVERLPWNVVYAEAKGEFWNWLKAYSMALYSFAHHAAAQHVNQ